MNNHDPESNERPIAPPSPVAPTPPVVRIPAVRSNEEGNEAAKVSSNHSDPMRRRVGLEVPIGQPPTGRSASTELGSPGPISPNIKISRKDDHAVSGATPPPIPESQAAISNREKTDSAWSAPQPRSAKSAWVVRTVILLAVAGCLSLLYWSVFMRLLPVTSEHRERGQEMTRSADELERLRARWTPQQIAEINEQYARAQEALFQNEEEIGNWEEETRNAASMRVLAATLEREPAVALAGADDIAKVTARLSVTPEDIFGSTNSPYNRLALFADAIARTTKRLDLVDLSVVGNSNSISQAQAVIEIFSTERKSL